MLHTLPIRWSNSFLRKRHIFGRVKRPCRQGSKQQPTASTGAGKTWAIFERHAPEHLTGDRRRAARDISCDCCHGQEVLVFEVFSGQMPIEDTLLSHRACIFFARTGHKKPCNRKWLQGFLLYATIASGGLSGATLVPPL